MTGRIDFSSICNEADEALIKDGLTELHSKRFKAWGIGCKIAYFNDHPPPARESYGIDRVEDLMVRLGVPFVTHEIIDFGNNRNIC